MGKREFPIVHFNIGQLLDGGMNNLNHQHELGLPALE
jgi:hypothetical protein